MAYTKQTWACGDEITADKLNHMEDGIEEAQNKIVIANLTITSDTTGTCDMSYDEIKNLTERGIPVIMTWTHKLDGGSLYLKSGCGTVECATGSLRIKINEYEWSCQNDGTTWTTYQN